MLHQSQQRLKLKKVKRWSENGSNEPPLPPEIIDRLALARWIAVAKSIDPGLGKRLLQNKETKIGRAHV